jgi:4-carboxymuconolactone decarboxylase
MARLPYVDAEQSSQEVKDTLQRLPLPLKIFHMMAHAETNFRSLVRLGGDILGRQQLDPKLRELAILRVANLSSARYEWVQHVPIAKAVGARDEQVAALERGEATAACFDERERRVLRFTEELLRDVRVSDPTFASVAELLSPREIVELILTVGYYMLIARLLETTAVDIESDAGTTIIDALRS